MKIVDTVYDYADGRHHLTRGMCRVRVFASENGPAVLLTDLGEMNDGASVTNAARRIMEGVVETGLATAPCAFIEHYENKSSAEDTFDLLTAPPNVQWKSISSSAALEILGCGPDELGNRSDSNRRIAASAETLRLRRDRFADSPFPEPPKVISRKAQIRNRMISRSDVQKLVDAGSGERELQRLIKSDLSIIAEAFSAPSDEYICFSEMPIADGQVDFAVFTSRSRMDVILIEVKGAEFNLVNSNGYREFNHKVLEAAGQLRHRLGLIYRDLDVFRENLHQIRANAEKGSPLFGAFLGPRVPLEVDPCKDINIRTVIIGGRTQDDAAESRKRHDFERGTSPAIRLESWDTWLRRLQRA
ncbi:Shedu immune nuclease family protein [Stenotrophomonas rhizophila]|uniref:DUF4263 domain-containing protein n=1 Tax=Stenotrophomonas rhizophila TaxID=216778 RepID=A0A7V7YKK1_9GAMM|nr:Shedu immune nuclease family protein [Stenotrophomonas rhizophila]KAB7632977.1 DUF4263 domain-containing protein [Stenotrophomonas rhizophila]